MVKFIKFTLPICLMHTIDTSLADLFRLCNINIFSEVRISKMLYEYSNYNKEKKTEFLRQLSHNYYIDRSALNQNCQEFSKLSNGDEVKLISYEEKMRKSLVPQYSHLFKNIAKLNNGVKLLVDMRADLLDINASNNMQHDLFKSHLKCMNETMKELLQIWFSVGLMNVERITWQSSCDMLQKISEYEAVHPIKNWSDLKRRVGPYRRCFAFTHKSMPGEPIVVLHVALTNKISNSIQTIVSHPRFNSLPAEPTTPLALTPLEDPSTFDTAIFYSISSTQKGLQNVELGNYLIKKVTAKLKKEFPNVQKFSSLSPIPGFKKWFLQAMTVINDPTAQSSPEVTLLKRIFTPSIMTTIAEHFPLKFNQPAIREEKGRLNPAVFTTLERTTKHFLDVIAIDTPQISAMESFWGTFSSTLADPTNAWAHDPKYALLRQNLENPLTKLCAHYIYDFKTGDGHALNNVANFHFRNGASFWRLNWMADPSGRGLDNSCGMMINYRYFLDDIEENSVRYMTAKLIPTSNLTAERLNFK